jgi:hypothetical protein
MSSVTIKVIRNGCSVGVCVKQKLLLNLRKHLQTVPFSELHVKINYQNHN